MKVLIINGSPRKNGNTAVAIREMEHVFAQEGVEVEVMQIGNMDIRGCTACGGCKDSGICVFDDVVNETAAKLENADGLVLASPVYFARRIITSSSLPLKNCSSSDAEASIFPIGVYAQLFES